MSIIDHHHPHHHDHHDDNCGQQGVGRDGGVGGDWAGGACCSQAPGVQTNHSSELESNLPEQTNSCNRIALLIRQECQQFSTDPEN